MHKAFTFDCQGDPLLGIIHEPENSGDIGVLMVTGGGPQYRVGGHRQLVIWGRGFAARGYPAMRFDYRGIGDSSGEYAGFEHIDNDLEAAINVFFDRCPKMKRLVLWGECNASSAIMMYASKDPRIVGMSLQNPWIRSDSGQAKTYLKYYYINRLRQRSFWKKVVQFDFNPFEAVQSLINLAFRARSATPDDRPAPDNSPALQASDRETFTMKMKKGMQQFQGKVLLIMSGRDLIAREFDEAVNSDPEWHILMNGSGITRRDIKSGDHTFSSAGLREEVLHHGISWLRTI